MRALRLTIRGFRGLADSEFELPPRGVTLLGANGQGKTSLLEALGYPVLFRSFRTSADAEITRFGEAGFHAGLVFERDDRSRSVAATFRQAGRRKRLELDGVPLQRLVEGAGAWLAVVFTPEDVRLASGPAAARRLYLDRTLALSDVEYMRALARYRAALAQRNAALRQGRSDLAAAFDGPLSSAGATIIARRVAWVDGVREAYPASMTALGEVSGDPLLGYAGAMELADPAAWPERLAQAASRDVARRVTTVGPHRDDLDLRLGGRGLREYGSTGQHRSAAIALKLLELETIEQATGVRPALLLDDIFAELDGERQRRLATRLFGGRPTQVFVTSPRADELPPGLDLPVWRVASGQVDRA